MVGGRRCNVKNKKGKSLKSVIRNDKERKEIKEGVRITHIK